MQTGQSTEVPIREPSSAESRDDSRSRLLKIHEASTQVSRYHYHSFAFHFSWEWKAKPFQTRRHIACKILFGGLTIIELGSSLNTSTFGLPAILFNFTVRNIISASSDIVKACQEGNLEQVKDFFQRHVASPNDMTDEQHPLLWVRILLRFAWLQSCIEHFLLVCHSEWLS